MISDITDKFGFKLDRSVKGHDVIENQYSNKKFIIVEYVTSDSVTAYLLFSNTNHVLDVEPNTDGDFSEWDEYLTNNQ